MKSEAQFEDIFQEQLEDLLDAETQIVQALPKWIAESSSESLSGALQMDLADAREQVVRLQAIFERMSIQPGARKCEAMQGLLSEGEKSIAKLKKSPALDIAIIAVAQKVKHYEIAAYGTVCALAEMLGQEEALLLLQQTLAEEKNAGEDLSELAESILSGDDLAPEGEEQFEKAERKK